MNSDNLIHIKKGLQKEVLFMGLKASYINYFIVVGLGSVLFGVFLSMILPTYIGLLVAVILLIVSFTIILFYSKTYGENGFSKKMADSKKPDAIRVSNDIETMLIWQKQ